MLNQKATVAGLKAKSEALRTEFAATQNEMKTLNEQQPRLDQLTGELDLAQASYRGYYQKHEQARIDQAARNESISTEYPAAAKWVAASNLATAFGDFCPRDVTRARGERGRCHHGRIPQANAAAGFAAADSATTSFLTYAFEWNGRPGLRPVLGFRQPS